MLYKTISKSGQKQAKKKKQETRCLRISQMLLYSVHSWHLWFSYLSNKGNLHLIRYSEFPVIRDNQWSGPRPCLSATPQLKCVKYPADTGQERERRNTMWYKMIIICILNQRLSILHSWFTTLAHSGSEAIFLSSN